MTTRPKPPADFDENPEWTAEDFAKARPAGEVHGAEIAALLVRKSQPIEPSENHD